MALRDENYLFTRRIADRGSDEIVFYSQDRKIQETNPNDVIRDEVVGKEEHPEDGDGYKFQETNSQAFIRDENFGKKEYLGSCSNLYRAPPVFDEYGDEEWYSWATGISVIKDEFLDNKSEKEDNHNDNKISASKKITNNDRVGKVLLIQDRIVFYLKSLDLTFNFKIEFRSWHLNSNPSLKGNLRNLFLSVEFLAHQVLLALIAKISLSNFSDLPNLNVLNGDVGIVLKTEIYTIIMELVTCPQGVLKTQFLLSKKKNRQSEVPFDPGDTSLELDDMFCEVKIFRRVVMVIKNWNHIDVPFDPGEYDVARSNGVVKLAENSRTSFFEEEEYDAG